MRNVGKSGTLDPRISVSWDLHVPFANHAPRMTSSFFRTYGILLLASVLITGCGGRGSDTGAAPPPITDEAYLTADHWNDGQAEVAFYRVNRTRDQYGRSNDQQFLVGTYLVKHRFSPREMTKTTDGTGVSSFKYALFYELESGSYQYKRNWVVNARQEDLRPFKQSFSSFDWCANQYREVAFPVDGDVQVRMRSDDYGNRRASFDPRSDSFPPAQLPLLIRSLDLSESESHSFAVVLADSNAHVSAQATLKGRDSVDTEAGTVDAERIVVTYDEPVPSMIGEESATTETYWRGTDPQRRLVQLEAGDGRYRMTLVEHVRSPYWKENIWKHLSRVEERP